MLKEIKKIANNLWWLLVISSIASIIFGIAALFMPGLTFAMLVKLFAALILVIGIVQIVHCFAFITIDISVWVSLLLGILLSAMGIYLIKHPVISIIAFVVIVGWVLIIKGVLEIIIGILTLKHKASWIFSGIIGIIVGIIVWVYPEVGTLAFIWVIGLYTLINGIISLSRAFAARIAYKAIINGVEAVSGK